MTTPPPAGLDALNVEFRRPLSPEHRTILTSGAVGFIVNLTLLFRNRVEELLKARADRQTRFDRGERPRHLDHTKEIRAAEWTVAPIPNDLLDRRVEITGPVDRKMIINALNSGAKVFMADFEDSNSPTFDNCIFGQANLYDAVRRKIEFTDPSSGKNYKLNNQIATLMVRPRGWHLREEHMLVNGAPVPASIFDFGLFFYHNAKEQIARGTGPYFYLPKMQSHLEARLWNDIFVYSQKELNIPRGTIRATVLIETLPAAFEMDEILYELREHSAGLNCGRWDYIFSYIKTFRADAAFVVPDRGKVTMEQPFLRSYTQLLVKTCHRRGAHAMGGMAAQIPIKNDANANEAALQKVRLDKLREVTDGHDGTWVAHPALVAVAAEIFDKKMTEPNQIHRKREDLIVNEADLLTVPQGPRTEAGLRQNINVGIQYLEAWLRGSGCVPLYNLMEDAATAEISRTQIWQWIRHRAALDDGRIVTKNFVEGLVEEECRSIQNSLAAAKLTNHRLGDARKLFAQMCFSTEFEEFLTLPAYKLLIATQAPAGLQS